VAWRRKMMFRAPMDAWLETPSGGHEPPERNGPQGAHAPRSEAGSWINQVLSPESIRKAGYFDPDAVAAARQKIGRMRRGLARTGLEMGLTAVTATQLWHHLYLGGGLCDLPTRGQESGVRSQEDSRPLASVRND